MISFGPAFSIYSRKVASLIGVALLLAAGCGRREVAEPPDTAAERLDDAAAGRLAALALACIDREYPNKPSNMLDGDPDVRPPRELTPAFYGCFDWHSAVHGHWTLVRQLRRVPQMAEAPAIRARLARHFTPELMAKEVAYFAAPRNRTFERPYGWGWLLRLATELRAFDDPDARRWAEAVAPLAQLLARRSAEYLPRLSAPVREGTHASTAFAMVHMLDYARTAGDADFARLLEQKARDLFLTDRACPLAYEPSGEDFISPCLVEADLMRRVLAPAELGPWLDAFLPPVGSPAFAPLLRPVEVRDRTDPRIGHLIGLGLQRASALEGLASTFDPSDLRADSFRRLARLHAHDALAQMFDSGYGGEHWLASFAIYLLTDVSGEAQSGKPPSKAPAR